MEPLFLGADGKPFEPAPPPRPIRPAAKPVSIPPAAPAGDDSVIRPFVNDEQNSRLAAALGSPEAWGRATVRWREALPGGLSPDWLLSAKDRLVVLGTSSWQLRSRSGSLVAEGPLTDNGVVLDEPSWLFLIGEEYGLLNAVRLTDGQVGFRISLGAGAKYDRRFLFRRDRRLIAITNEKPQPETDLPPTKSLVALVDLGVPGAWKSFDQPGGPTALRQMIVKYPLLLGAMHGDSLVLAAQDHIATLDAGLNIRQILTGAFVPMAFSLDEAARIYLVVQNGERIALWLLTPEGEQVYACEFPPGLTTVAGPPIVSHDHVAYVISGQQILAVAPDGKIEWMRSAHGSLAGATVTADDYLLVSDGDSLVALNRRGDRHVLYSITGAPLSTPPILTAGGQLLAASGAALYCLAR